jgi:Type I restriction enzyme R protein N terminus (HSDR_N)
VAQWLNDATKAGKLFTDFNPSLLDDPEFKEDAVREVIITPLLTRLGYSPSGVNRIIRSKSLAHPFIYAGTRKVPVTLIPDYTLLGDQTPLLILDAKRPTESVLSKENVQQAYSYAIHPEIKCQHFALCNGKMLTVFSVDDDNPLLVVPFAEYDSGWSEIEKYISPRYLKQPILRKFAPDFGTALSRLGLAENAHISLFPAKLNFFGRVSHDLMTASSNTIFADKEHCVSFDFDHKLLPEILTCLPAPLADAFNYALCNAPFQAAAELAIELDVTTRLGVETRGESESFRPLVIEKMHAARFDPLPLPDETCDIPSHIFRLRKAYVLHAPDDLVKNGEGGC